MGDGGSTLTGVAAGVAFALLLLAWAYALTDLARRDDLGTGAKLLWAAVVLVLAFVGVVLYVLFRPRGATARERAARREASDEFVRTQTEPPPGPGPDA